MVNQNSASIVFFLCFLLIATETKTYCRFAQAQQRRIQITDDLDDVVDDEEDESWREWGKKKSPASDSSHPHPVDFTKMSLPEIQAEMMKLRTEPVFGFVKLRFGFRRTPEMVSEIATKWSNLARTGGIETKLMGVDLGTIMFTMEKGQDTEELKEFLLSQEEAYEIKVGDQLFRRPGDPPFEEVLMKLQSEKSEADQTSSERNDGHHEL